MQSLNTPSDLQHLTLLCTLALVVRKVWISFRHRISLAYWWIADEELTVFHPRDPPAQIWGPWLYNMGLISEGNFLVSI